MDKRKALTILIQHSFSLPETYKRKLFSSIDKLSDKEVLTLGKTLALEKKRSMEENKNLITSLEQFLSKISK